jgi:hypothetical protein
MRTIVQFAVAAGLAGVVHAGGTVAAGDTDTVAKKSGHTVTPTAANVAKTPAAPGPVPIPYPNASDGVTGDKSPQAARQTPKTDFGSVIKQGLGKGSDAQKAEGSAQKEVMLTPIDVANRNPAAGGNGAPDGAFAPRPPLAPLSIPPRESVPGERPVEARATVKPPMLAAPTPIGLPVRGPAPVMVAPPVKLEQPLQVQQPVLVQPVQLQPALPVRR